MRVSYRWLQELLPGLNASPAEVGQRLAGGGLAVDGTTSLGATLAPLSLVEVRRIEPHPARSGLRLVTVNRGEGHEQRLVCGASNVPDPGGLVVLAPLGANLPSLGVPLAARDIGGVRSEGMLCSETELGLSESSEGIVTLPPGSFEAGTPFVRAFPTAVDTIYELDITPNRPDALGHVGVARDLAALLRLPFTLPTARAAGRTADVRIEQLVAVDNQDSERCPHYGAALSLEAQVRPSPAWVRWRLFSLGIRPISNIVDITNWLMLEWGHPMHAFDLDRVRGSHIVVRRARAGEPFTTLDGVARQLDADDLVIADTEGPTALAGIMGGQDSEIRESTTRVLLECAYFTPRGVRRSARRHGMHTDSSHRFERGVDYANIARVLGRAQDLLEDWAGAARAQGTLHASFALPERPTIALRRARLDRLLGVEVPFSEAVAALERLGFEISERHDDRVVARGASWRPDVAIEADLIEEVARVRGLDAIPTRLPAIPPQRPTKTGQLERQLAGHATALGLSEALTYAFVAAGDLEALGAPAPVVKLANPLTEERSVMRTSLLPGLLEALRRSRRHGEASVQLFAIGARFLPSPPNEEGAQPSATRPRREGDHGVLPEERPSFAALLAGTRPSYLGSKPQDCDVYDAKGVALELVFRLTGREARVVVGETRPAHLHPRAYGHLLLEDRPVGTFGTLHPDVADAYDLGGSAELVELDLAALEQYERTPPQYRPIPRVPAVTRDVAFELPESVSAGNVEAAIRSSAGELCESVELFDLFRGAPIAEGRRSLAFHIVYRDPKARTQPDAARTLTDKEVDERQTAVVQSVTAQFGGAIRG